MDEPKRVVRDGYDRIARDYETWGEHFGVRRKYLSQLRAAVPIGERVVDLGCGTGRHATAALAEQYRVVGVDISPVSASLARQAVPTAQFVVGDMTDVAFRPGVFGGVTAFFSLIHVPRDQQLDVLRATRSWLKPGGVLVVTMGVSDVGDVDRLVPRDPDVLEQLESCRERSACRTSWLPGELRD